MSKGIVLVDIPDKCDGCEMCGTLIGKVICVAMIKRIHDINARPEWCPIKPLPEKKLLTGDVNNTEKMGHELVRAGWNACIDKLLKDGVK